MNRITAPIDLGEHGDAVVNVQDGLRWLITARRIKLDDGEHTEV